MKTWYAIFDGGRARFVTRHDDQDAYETHREFVSTMLHVPSRELGTSRPGRAHESASLTRHAIQPRIDPHMAEKYDFIREVAGELNQAGSADAFDRLVLIAPARQLQALLDALNPATKAKVASRMRKDLTHVPDVDLADHLTESVHG